ncbi:hypothetical protein GCM10017044_02460 [Kordiimonas sediminis]|uniref:PNPLA domain-containing protein n=1 Tax=Kordiimonas sediminis TaxID=1735581 RepID=A0A919AIY5_9PROT|nr:patatin-like protein [Kordiimonas sediminis]GHF12077.1 hypothetical protein GCM10017044_02460 [Kordiimonas sediminis]
MRELELRLALVCYGGASLAVYMNGISNEILKLVRASRAFHDSDMGTEERFQKYPEVDTERLYAELLEALAPQVKLRVIVDVVSGASAGGINGIFLSRALAHDLSLAPLRHMWLNLGDIEQLMDQDTLAGKWSKFYLYPLFYLFKRRIHALSQGDPEMENKLMRFVRSRWFQPPFSGKVMLGWMLDACTNMGKAETCNSLLPPGHKLDLFVSLTNFFGQRRSLSLHDPDQVTEHQHGLTAKFSYRRQADGTEWSELNDDHIAGLGFVARATSSFPGAFPPVRLKDLAETLKERGQTWDGRDTFIAHNFPAFVDDTDTLFDMSFIDGGVTNNKPFASAIQAIYERPAHREVDRRIIYVDPMPDDLQGPDTGAVPAPPGFFRTILSSLAEIPRREPIYEDLRGIARQNKLARRHDLVTDTVEKQVRKHVDGLLSLDASRMIDTALLASWREQAHTMAYSEAGYSYGAYSHTKAIQLLDHIADIAKCVAERSGDKDSIKDIQDTLVWWSSVTGLLPTGTSMDAVTYDEGTAFKARILLFRGLDLDFRIRRIRFVIKKINRYVQRSGQGAVSRGGARLKKVLYTALEGFTAYLTPDPYMGFSFDWASIRPGDPESVNAVLKVLEEAMNLEEQDYNLDYELAQILKTVMDTGLRQELFRAYVGFAFFDVVTFPLSVQTDVIENDEIRVDRISPQDCPKMLGQDMAGVLMGNRLNNFGAFFSRRARENDYLWGRLHAAKRLVDFVIDAAGPDALPPDFDIDDFMRRLYISILETEKNHAERAQDIISDLLHKFQ